MKECKSCKYMFVTRTLTGGGAERFIATFSSYLADLGHEVYVVSYEKSPNDYELSGNVNAIYLKERKENLYRKLMRIVDLRRIIIKHKPDVVIPFINTVMFCARLATLLTPSKLVFTVRVSPWHRGGSGVSMFLEDLVSRHSDAIMVQTKEQGEFFAERYQNKIFVVPNPVNQKFVNTQKETYRDKITRLTMAGRLDRQKNYPLAIRCFSELHAQYPDLKLEIYGDGGEYDNLRKLINDVQLGNSCRLMGRCDHIERVLADTDLFLMSSDYEGMPNALMEAMTVGVPCISSDCRTGPKDLIIPGETGMLFETGDQDGLRDAVRLLIEDPHLAEQLGTNARTEMVSTFTLEKTYSAFMEMCSSII